MRQNETKAESQKVSPTCRSFSLRLGGPAPEGFSDAWIRIRFVFLRWSPGSPWWSSPAAEKQQIRIGHRRKTAFS